MLARSIFPAQVAILIGSPDSQSPVVEFPSLNVESQWLERYQFIYDAMIQHSTGDLSRKRILSLGYTDSTDKLFDFLRAQGAQISAVGLEAPEGKELQGIYRKEIEEFA